MQENAESNPVIEEHLQQVIAAAGGQISFAEFMAIALYHPEAGYYQQSRTRVGFGPESDFFTASSVGGGVFRQLLIDACRTLLSPDSLGDFDFVEIGAEPANGVLTAEHPFRTAATSRLGETPQIQENAIVFSNELFDAQPFHRLLFRKNRWQEIGVQWNGDFTETLLPSLSPPVAKLRDYLPATAPEEYHLDLPIAAAELAKALTKPGWNGLFIAFDYGKSWRELIEETPQGTARAYSQHQQLNDLLAHPGQQDLTCHICWDWLQEALRENGFQQIEVQSQEAFFVTKATGALQAIISAQPGKFDPRRQSLQQLIYPGHMGQKFQVLTARR